jgi:hypothetical protein
VADNETVIVGVDLNLLVLGLALGLLVSWRMITVLVIFGLIAAGLGIGLIATATAPMGYQDETGFHMGRHQEACEHELAYAVPQPKLG